MHRLTSRAAKCALAMVVSILLIPVSLFSTASSMAQVDICVPNQSVLPFYIVNDNKVSGMTIDRLNRLFQEPALQELNVNYVIQPWQRCLIDIEKGQVDLIIAGYSDERAAIAVFPNKIGYSLQESAFSYSQICLIKRKSAQWSWYGDRIEGLEHLLIGIEPGFLVPASHTAASSLQYTAIWDVSQKYQLVIRERVNAVLSVCNTMGRHILTNDNLPPELEVVFPPFLSSPAFLVFSQLFYAEHQQLTTTIINTSNAFYMSGLKNNELVK